jgi:hypothetical protein
MKTLSRFVAAAALAVLMLAGVSSAQAQHSASWKGRGLPNTTVPAANYVGRSNLDAGYNYTYNYTYRRPQIYAYNYAPAYRPAPRYYSAPPAFTEPAPQIAGPGASDEARRTFSAQPGVAPAPTQAAPKAPAQAPYQAPQQAPAK